jgi:hypothetical protein
MLVGVLDVFFEKVYTQSEGRALRYCLPITRDAALSRESECSHSRCNAECTECCSMMLMCAGAH